MRCLRLIGLLLSDALLALGLLWVVGLFIFRPWSILFSALLLLPGLLICFYRNRRYSRSLRSCVRPLLWGLLLLSACITYPLLSSPKHADWQAPWGKAPQFSREGDLLTITHVRDFRYRSEHDYDVRYRTETYDLNQLTGVDLGECHWDGMEAVCHTMLSFAFADGRHLVVSAETRLPRGVEQSTLGGLYKLYGLLYVFGTEEDIFALRTNYRHEDLTLYPLKVTPQQARRLLMACIHLAIEAEAKQLPYNTVTDNCSSGLVRIFRHFEPDMPARYNLLPLHNSSISRLICKHGGMLTQKGESFEALSRRCYLGYDLAKENLAGYSAALREKRGQ